MALKIIRRLPDWLLYAGLLFIILANAKMRSQSTQAPAPPPELGRVLPNVKPSDPTVIVEIDAPTTSIGTAFAVDNMGTWLTARHVVDGCDAVGLRLDGSKYVKVKVKKISGQSDTAILISKWRRPALARDFKGEHRTGEYGFFMGFPQGKPGEAAGTLLGRHKMVVRGRYRTTEPVFAWTEIGRSKGLSGSLGGLSGGPAFDKDGEVIGLVSASSPRRGRIYTVAPKSLDALVSALASEPDADATDINNYGKRADKYRRTRRIAQVVCLVD